MGGVFGQSCFRQNLFLCCNVDSQNRTLDIDHVNMEACKIEWPVYLANSPLSLNGNQSGKSPQWPSASTDLASVNVYKKAFELFKNGSLSTFILPCRL